MNHSKFSTLYKITLSVTYDKKNVITISPSDIVSIAIIHNYDTMTFPMIRIRLYADISVIQRISEFPDDIIVQGTIDGNIYRMPEESETSPQQIKPTPSISFNGLKAYIKQKNIATSSMDQYVQGVKRETSLNQQTKVPIELLCYQDQIVHRMHTKIPSVYKNVSIEYVLRYLLHHNNIPLKQMDVVENQRKYNQLLIPNLEVIEAFTFIDDFYGLYRKGSQLYCDIDGVYVTNTDIGNKKPIPIHVRSANSNDDMSGLRKLGDKHVMGTMATNVSIASESNLQKAINPNKISSIDLNDSTIVSTDMMDSYTNGTNDGWNEYVLHHKTQNEFITEMYHARVKEKATIVSVSGNGFEIGTMKINSRYHFIWESPQRGQNINAIYRPTFTNHVFTNLDSNLFSVDTTMNLVTN